MTFTTNQFLVAGLILALLVMAGALVAIAIRAIKLMKNAEVAVGDTKGLIGEIKEIADKTKGTVEAKMDSINSVATGVAGGIVSARLISKLHIFKRLSARLDRRNARLLEKEAKTVKKATRKVVKANKKARKVAKAEAKREARAAAKAR